MPPVSAARSVSARICSLYFAVKLRRFGASVNSAEATTGAATTRAAAADAGLSGEEGKTEASRSGITIRSFSCAIECKLQTVECRTLVGTVGIGGELKVYLAQRVYGKTAAFSTGVFVCMRCQTGRAPAGNMIDYYPTATGAVWIMALCEVCEGPLSAFTNTAALAKLARTYELVLCPPTQDESSNGTKSKTTQRRRPHARSK